MFTSRAAQVRQLYGNRLPRTIDEVIQRYWYYDDVSLDDDSLTLVHGDCHPAKMFFPQVTKVVSLPSIGSRLMLVKLGRIAARIIVLSLTTKQRKEHEERLLQLYHAILNENGVNDYDIERCWLSFRCGFLYNVKCFRSSFRKSAKQ